MKAPTPVAEPAAPFVPPTEDKKKKEAKSFYPEAFGPEAEPPKSLWKSRRIGNHTVVDKAGKKTKGVLHVAGRGSKTADVLFLSGSVFREEEFTKFTSEPAMLQGPAGNLFLRMLNRCGFKTEEFYYTALCKYNVPKLKPSTQDIRWNAAILDDELKTIKPKLIVCCGKLPFDHLFKTKFKLKEIQGGFFRCEQYDCLLYAMDTLMTPLMKPEFQERMMVDLREVKKCLNEINGVCIVKVPTQYETIDTAQKLSNLMGEHLDEIKRGNLFRFGVDCEWHGQTAWSGELRSMQWAWKPGRAAYLRLRAPVKEEFKYVFDKELPVVREILDPVMNHPKVKFVGHNIHADMPWMDEHLEIDVYNRTEFDTMFAQHTLDEYADLKLERMAVRYTDLGRYDIDLLLWKKKNSVLSEDGYGFIPDSIIIPYGCRDVDATLRVFPILAKRLIQENLWTYYQTLVRPFVSDGFYELMSTGIPIDRDYLDEMRDTYTHHGDALLEEFRLAVQKEADMFMRSWLVKHANGRTTAQVMGDYVTMSKSETQAARKIFEGYCTTQDVFTDGLPIFQHWVEAKYFNQNSAEHMKRWLFDVKKFVPLKTTKKDGIQMAWERVLTLSPDLQSQYQPATDKQSMKVFATKDKLVAQLEEVKSVKNITKAFLKEPDEDGTENGLHSWIQPDMRIHANFALTETARTRSWQPNILNFPKAITKPLENAFERINIKTVKTEAAKTGAVVSDKQVKALRIIADPWAKSKDQDAAMKELMAAGHGADAVDAYARLISLPVSIRSAARAPEGHALLDMDLKTAEVVALAWLSGDVNLQKVLTEPDVQFARTDKENPKKAKRICFNDNVNLPEAARDPKLLVSVDDPSLLRDSFGNLLHPLRDVHWEMAEETAGGPRETLEERLYRDGCGKVGNFCLLHSSRVLTHRGEVAIQEVQLTDLLWDGVEWVSHEGVVCNGTKLTHCYQGLWATDNHEVWIDNGNKVLFGDARRNGWNLLRTGQPHSAPNSGTLDRVARTGAAIEERTLRTLGAVQALRSQEQEVPGSTGAREAGALHMREQQVVSGSEVVHLAHQICSNDTALREGQSSGLNQLQRQGHRGVVRVLSRVCGLGVEEVAGHGFQGFGVRPGGQQRPLLTGQYTACDQKQESAQQEEYADHQHRDRTSVFDDASGGGIHSDVGGADVEAGYDAGGNSPGPGQQSQSGEAKAGCQDGEAQVGLVYDILNAGPRHRFTCSGVLVSNSIPYGATATLLERMIEANTGIKPPPGTGQKMIDSHASRYPTATDFQMRMERCTEDPGYYRSISGRVRHFFFNQLSDVAGLGDYTREGILSPLKRQARNFPPQEIVAATAARALLRFIKERRERGLSTRIMMSLYDAMTAITPLEELKEVTTLLKNCLTIWTPWTTTYGSTFNFDVDVNVGFRWGVKPTKDEKELIARYL